MSPVFRKEQRHLTVEERQQINDLKQLAEDLHDLIDMLPASRARDIAQIRLEECVMWSVKAQSDAR
jgi:hypothetical protein